MHGSCGTKQAWLTEHGDAVSGLRNPVRLPVAASSTTGSAATWGLAGAAPGAALLCADPAHPGCVDWCARCSNATQSRYRPAGFTSRQHTQASAASTTGQQQQPNLASAASSTEQQQQHSPASAASSTGWQQQHNQASAASSTEQQQQNKQASAASSTGQQQQHPAEHMVTAQGCDSRVHRTLACTAQPSLTCRAQVQPAAA